MTGFEVLAELERLLREAGASRTPGAYVYWRGDAGVRSNAERASRLLYGIRNLADRIEVDLPPRGGLIEDEAS